MYLLNLKKTVQYQFVIGFQGTKLKTTHNQVFVPLHNLSKDSIVSLTDSSKNKFMAGYKMVQTWGFYVSNIES